MVSPRSWRWMPRPVEALPWGSIPITRVGAPTAARAVPRLIAVVVLPTPPFCLATTRTRGLAGSDMAGTQLSHGDYSSGRLRLAWHLRRLHVPIFMGFGQFSHYILSFKEQANAIRACERMGILQQLGQGAQSPCCHHIENLSRQFFQTGISYGDFHPHPLCGGLEEGALFGGGFVQGHSKVGPQQGQHQAWKAGARTQIRQST